MSDVDIVETEQKNLKERMDKHDDEMIRVWQAIDGLKNRLPNWAVLVISTLTAAVGWLGSHIK